MSQQRKYLKLEVHQLSNDIRKASRLTESFLRLPDKDEILLRNHFVGVNPLDMNIITGRSKLTGQMLPFDLGMEGLGVIEAIGKDVDGTKYQIGQIGLVLARTPKTYAEYVYVKPHEFYNAPQLEPKFLALLDCGLTATIGLDKSAQIKSGEVVFITAAAGGTGHIAVQWAKRKGCKVIGLTSSPEKASFLSSIGVDRVINYKKEDLSTILLNEYPSGIDVIWETIGGSMFETLFNHLAIGGRIIIVGAISGYKTVGFPEIHIENLPTKLLNKSASIIGFRFRHFESYFEHYLTELIDLYCARQLTVRVDCKNSDGSPFAGVSSVIDAIQYQQSGLNLGKVVVAL